MKKTAFAVTVILSAALVYFLAARPREDVPAAASPGNGPVLIEKTLDGRPISLSQFAGKVVLVDFWATWCEPCQEELPSLVAMRDKLAPQGFEILGVSMDDNVSDVRRFLKKRPLSYPVAFNGGQDEPKGWTVPGLPTAYLIGRDGTVLKRWFGEKDMDELQRDVEAALAAK